MDDQTTRLNRIEEKLDKVGEAVISLARMEEKMITLFNKMDSYDKKQEKIEERLSELEVKQASSAWIERVIFLGMGAVVTYLIK